MCEYAGRLVAWIDREVSAGEASEIARHVEECAECRSCVAELRNVSGKFEEYCEAVLQASERSGMLWRNRTPAAAAAAIMLAVLAVYPRRHAVPLAPHANSAATISKPAPDATRVASLRPARDAAETRTAAISPPRANTERAHASRAVANASAVCCTVAKMKSATADSADAVPHAAVQNANWIVNEPSVEIAISAAAMFPPGAMPDGINFVADLSIGADGSVQQVRLQPQISEFERRSREP